MADTDPERAFYVGYLSVPGRHRRFLLVLLPTLLLGLATAALAITLSQRSPGKAVWDTGLQQDWTGLLTTDPYPMLTTDAGESFLVVGMGKFGVHDRVEPHAGARCRLSGWSLARDERRMIELDPGPGAIEVLDAELSEFAAAITAENHTLKRALTDPRLLSGIGNAYSDEILHRARMSPVKLTQKLGDAELETLFTATRETLEWWIDHLRREVGDGFPDKVTAFRPEMAVHGKYREPCPDCGAPVQRIVHASNETNYCAKCQTGGKLLADRALSRLLKKDWPRTLEELEERRNL